MTNKQLKFYKLNSTSENLAGAKAVEGAIIYVVDVNELWIGGAEPKLVLKGANDVTFENNILTVTHYNNAGVATPQRLDFNDVASAEQTFKVFQNVYGLIGSTPSGTQQTLDYSGTQYIQGAQSLVAADKILDGKIYENSIMGVQSSAVYDTQHLSSTWTDVVNANAIQGNNTVRDSVEKVDKKVARLADEVIINEEVTQQAFAAVANSVGLEQDMSLDLKDASLNIIKNDTSVKKALIDLDAAFAEAGKVDDVKVNDGSIVSNKIANIAVDGTYNASTNKIATEDTVKGAINALDVTTDTGAASVSDSTITINAVQQENGLIKNGGSITINLDGTYNATDNKIATKSTVTSAIEALDTQSDVHDVVYTQADASNGAKLTFKGVSETDGVIAQGSGATELQFAKVATTGAAADVTIADAKDHTTQTTVEGAIDEIYGRVEALEGSFDVIKSVDAGTTPAGVTWIDNSDPENPQTITGTLTADDTTFHKVYLVPNGQSGKNSYAEYVTTRTNTGTEQAPVYVYGWEKLGDIDIDLTGYVKQITVNGKQYTVDTDSTNITLTDVITAITGENAIASGNTDFVRVTATTTKTEANGTNVTALSTTAKVQAVATADASNQGLAEASDVKAYVDGEIQKLDATEYQQASVEVDATNHTSALKIKGIQETDGKIAAATTTPTTDVAIDGEYNATSNKIATQSTVSGIVEGLDVDDYKQATVDTATAGQTSITIKGIKEVDGKIGASASAQDTTIVADGTYNETDNKLATQSTVTDAINGLDASITSDEAAVATVKVVETDGKITDVVVTNTSAGVNYTASTDSTAANLTASTGTGAVTGADIDTIKRYVDDKSAMCWEEYEK